MLLCAEGTVKSSLGMTLSPNENGSNYSAPLRSLYDHDFCHESLSSCRDRVGHPYSPEANCHCDTDLCRFYDDCCYDATFYSPLKGILTHQTVPNEQVTCHRSLFEDYSIYVVDECPVDFENEGIRQKCNVNETLLGTDMEEILLYVPVTSNKTGIVYRNIFCAGCHGLTDLDVQFWRLTITCKPKHVADLHHDGIETPADQVAAMKDCKPKFEFLPLDTPRFCFDELLIDRCPENFPEPTINSLCVNHTAYRYRSDGVIFRNKYCAVCNDVSPSNLECHPWASVGRPWEVPVEPPSYQVLLDFNMGKGYGQENKLVVDNNQCDIGYKYDPFSAKCRFLFCPDGFEFLNGICLMKPNGFPSANTDSMQACPLISLNASEVVFGVNGSLYIKDADLTLTRTDYSEDGSTILICSHLLERNQTTDTWQNMGHGKVQWMLSLIGVLLSMLSLTALIVIYGCYQSLQNTPGKCLLALSSSLLSGQLMFLLSTSLVDHKVACILIGTLMHFSFLCSFCWMNVLAFDIWRTFTRQYQRAPQAKGNRRFIRHSVYAFGVPFVIVMACLVLDLVDSDSKFSPQYGSYICWISNKYFLIAAFAVPLACVILTNAIFFAMSVYHIHKVSRSTKICHRPSQDDSSSDSSTRRQLVLYVKLSTIMGLTWFFGFVANFTAVAIVFWYLFIICNSLQGVFIALGFLWNDTVLRLLKKTMNSRFGQETSVNRTTESSSKRATLNTSV